MSILTNLFYSATKKLKLLKYHVVITCEEKLKKFHQLWQNDKISTTRKSIAFDIGRLTYSREQRRNGKIWKNLAATRGKSRPRRYNRTPEREKRIFLYPTHPHKAKGRKGRQTKKNPSPRKTRVGGKEKLQSYLPLSDPKRRQLT